MCSVPALVASGNITWPAFCFVDSARTSRCVKVGALALPSRRDAMDMAV